MTVDKETIKQIDNFQDAICVILVHLLNDHAV